MHGAVRFLHTEAGVDLVAELLDARPDDLPGDTTLELDSAAPSELRRSESVLSTLPVSPLLCDDFSITLRDLRIECRLGITLSLCLSGPSGFVGDEPRLVQEERSPHRRPFGEVLRRLGSAVDRRGHPPAEVVRVVDPLELLVGLERLAEMLRQRIGVRRAEPHKGLLTRDVLVVRVVECVRHVTASDERSQLHDATDVLFVGGTVVLVMIFDAHDPTVPGS